MQQNDQDISFNGLQLINQNLLSPACLQSVSNFPNVMLNQQGQLVVGNGQQSMQAMLLNPQNLLLNQQLMNQQQASTLSQFLPQNQLITSSGQQIYLANIGNFYTNLNNGNHKGGQLPLQTIVMAPTGLIPSTIIGTIPNGQQQKVSSRKNGIKKSSAKSSASSKKVATSKKSKWQSIKSNGSTNGNSKFAEEEDSENEMYPQENEMQQESPPNTDMETEDEETVEHEPLSRGCQVGQIKNIYAQLEDSDEEDECDEEMVHDLDDLESLASDSNSSDDEDGSNEVLFNEDDDKLSIHSGMSSLPDLSYVKKERGGVENAMLSTRYSAREIAKLSVEDKNALLLEIKDFAKKFKCFRTDLEMTQETASKEISTYIKCSQSKLCRFEQYGLKNKSAPKLLANLLENPKKLCSALQNMQTLQKYMLMKKQKVKEMGEISVSKTRKRRTNFKAEAVQILNEFFGQNAHPGDQEIKELSKQTAYSFQEIKVWFNNKRQSSKQSGSRE